MNILSTVHMIIGILGILALIAATVYAFGSKPEREWPRAKIVFSLTTGLLDLQLLVGLILLVWLLTGGTPVRWIHVILMVIAVILTHYSSRIRQKNRAATLVTTLAALLFVLAGASIVSM